MTNESLITHLKKLVAFDQQLSRLKSERIELNGREEVLSAQLKAAQTSHQKETLKLKELEKANRLEELNVQTLTEQISGRRRALLTLGNYKLQDAATREIATTERQMKESEEKNLAVMQKVEEKQLQLLQIEESVKVLEAQLEELKASLAQQLDTVTEREEKIRSQRIVVAQNVDAKILSEYDRMYERRAPDVIAIIENNACSECAESVAPKVLLEIQAGNSIVKCRGCGKMLAH